MRVESFRLCRSVGKGVLKQINKEILYTYYWMLEAVLVIAVSTHAIVPAADRCPRVQAAAVSVHLHPAPRHRCTMINTCASGPALATRVTHNTEQSHVKCRS